MGEAVQVEIPEQGLLASGWEQAVQEVFQLMNLDLDQITMYCDAWGVKRLDGYMKRIFALLTYYWGGKSSGDGVGGGRGSGNDGDDDDDDFDDNDDDQCEALSCRMDGYGGGSGGEPEADTPAAPTGIEAMKAKLASLRC
eukprot:symbB.v1.2.001915.t1/scaffold102.1/size330044/12